MRAIKLVFLTAMVTKAEELESAGRIGGRTFIAKPVSADEFCRIVADQLRE